MIAGSFRTRLLSTTAASSRSVKRLLFSSQNGDAWLLDVRDQLAVRLARDGDRDPIHLKETDASFAMEWKGHYRIDSSASIYTERQSGRITTILGYPTKAIS